MKRQQPFISTHFSLLQMHLEKWQRHESLSTSCIRHQTKRALRAHLHQLLVPFSVQMPEKVPPGHLHHCDWEVLSGDARQPLQGTPCFSDTQNMTSVVLPLRGESLTRAVALSL